MKINFVVKKEKAYILHKNVEYANFYAFLKDNINDLLGTTDIFTFEKEGKNVKISILGTTDTVYKVVMTDFIGWLYIRDEQHIIEYIKDVFKGLREWYNNLATYNREIEI